MLNIYIIHPKLCPIYITQFYTDTIDCQMSLLTYIHSYMFYYILRFIFFIQILLARTIYIILFHLQKVIPFVIYYPHLVLAIPYLLVLISHMSRLHLRVSIISMYVVVNYISPV